MRGGDDDDSGVTLDFAVLLREALFFAVDFLAIVLRAVVLRALFLGAAAPLFSSMSMDLFPPLLDAGPTEGAVYPDLAVKLGSRPSFPAPVQS